VAMGQRVGMAGVLVLSGATTTAAAAASEIRPDYVVEGIHNLLPEPTTDSRSR
jgi:ribonucleotide monophosphatase NagD (HAD superfamily)